VGFLEVIGGRMGVAAELQSVWQQEARSLVGCLEAALASGNATDVVFAAHRVKSALSVFRTAATDVAAKMEQRARAGRLGAAAALMDKLFTSSKECEQAMVDMLSPDTGN
jgi:hypothetical protein